MDWKHLLGSLSEPVTDDLRLRIDYLTAENRTLRQQICGRVHLSDRDRKALGEIGRQLGRKALFEIATIAQPDSIVAWGRTFTDKQVDIAKSRKSVGRPRVDQEIEDLVTRMARENCSWGYDCMQGALKYLGYTISDQTVGHILKRHSIPPAPKRKQSVTWGEFVRSHLHVLLATDFFTSEAWGWFDLRISSLLWFVHVAHRRTCAVINLLQHFMQGLQSHEIRYVDVSTYVSRWMPVVTKRLQPRTIRCSEASLKPAVSEPVPCNEGHPLFPDTGQVVVLSHIYHRPIRDGPIRHQQRLTNLSKDNQVKAA